MTDAHDEAARALDAEIRETLPPLLRPSTPLEDGLMRQIIAAALRKAAADELLAVSKALCDAAQPGVITGGFIHADTIAAILRTRARAKGGA